MKNAFSFLSILMLALFFTVPSLSVADADVIEIKVGTVLPVKHRLTSDAFKQYGREIETRTNGRIKFKWFLAGSLVTFETAKKGLKNGLVDMVLFLPVYVSPNEYPISRMLQLPFMVDSAAHAALTYYKAFNEIPEMREEYKDLKPLGFFSCSIIDLHTKGTPPKDLNELGGMRVWCGEKQAISMFRLLSASPRHTKIQDVYMSLQKGMVDGVFFPTGPIRSFKISELVSNHTMGGFTVGPQFYAMNLKKWNSLPEDVQKVFEDMTMSAGCQTGATATNETKWVIDDLKARGDNFYYLPASEKQVWKKKLQPLTDNYIEVLNKKGMDGQAIYNKLLECAEWARRNPYKPDPWWGRTGRK